ncbi:hypothetical protein [Bacillus tuaregi]|uniref:hypothetical protein n=1 Tax=Bacillus tuaregi TaxID=1816695 RepID=UPI0008F8752B|nr:hypothetical protein [Bacillus tuaregi]
MKRKNKHLQLIQLLGIFILIYIVVEVMQNLKIYFVYSSGVGPFLFIGFILVLIVVLYIKG